MLRVCVPRWVRGCALARVPAHTEPQAGLGALAVAVLGRRWAANQSDASAKVEVIPGLGLEAFAQSGKRVSHPRGSRGRHHKQGRRWKEKIFNNNRTRYEFNKAKEYDVVEALQHVRSNKWTKFDESLDILFRLRIDTRHADQMVRGMYLPPNGLGGNVKRKVAVFIDPEDPLAEEARAAGAELVGGGDLIRDLSALKKIKNAMDYAIATPDMMPKIAPLARRLAPHKLMPNPKFGTVTNDVLGALKLAFQGNFQFKSCKQGQVQMPLGRLSMSDQELMENLMAAFEVVTRHRPEKVKKGYFKAVSISSTMGQGVLLDWKLLDRGLLQRPADEVAALAEKEAAEAAAAAQRQAEKDAAAAARAAEKAEALKEQARKKAEEDAALGSGAAWHAAADASRSNADTAPGANQPVSVEQQNS